MKASGARPRADSFSRFGLFLLCKHGKRLKEFWRRWPVIVTVQHAPLRRGKMKV